LPEVDAAKRTRVSDIYIALMQNIKTRIEAVQMSLQEVNSNANHPDVWKNAEFCYLQIRKICECMALAASAGHDLYLDEHTSVKSKEWHADAIFRKLTKTNKHCFPVACTVVRNEGQQHTVNRNGDSMTIATFSEIYGQCAGRLHVGSLRNILNQTLPAFDFPEIAQWLNQLCRLLSQHMIMMPDINKVMIVTLIDDQNRDVPIAFAEANGAFKIDGDDQIYGQLISE
jgi:hypothetical protein